jgi:SAM-dependent methyltransferase
MNKIEIFYPEARFGKFTDVDGTINFFTRVNGLLEPHYIVLDVGCGKSTIQREGTPIRKSLRTIRGKVAKVIGIDVDKNAQGNPFIDEFRLIESQSWPIDDESIDLVVSDSVLEHVEIPNLFFSEAQRVLRSGGYLCLRTPNRWSYFGLLASVIPNKYHSKTLNLAGIRREDGDVFPTLYRCNSIRKIRKLMKEHGFGCVVYGHEGEPSFLEFSITAFCLGVLYQKIAPSFLRTSIHAFGRRLPR